jgi:hypothetical protein
MRSGAGALIMADKAVLPIKVTMVIVVWNLILKFSHSLLRLGERCKSRNF